MLDGDWSSLTKVQSVPVTLAHCGAVSLAVAREHQMMRQEIDRSGTLSDRFGPPSNDFSLSREAN